MNTTQEIDYSVPETRAYVDGYHILSIAEFGRGILHPHPNEEELRPLMRWEDRAARLSRWGNITLIRGEHTRRIDYHIYLANPARIELRVWSSGNEPSFEQAVHLGVSNVRYGQRPWLMCRCGRRCGTLYLRRDRLFFSCKKCLSLIYYHDTGTRQDDAKSKDLAWTIDWHPRGNELANLTQRVKYRNQYTRRAKRALKLLYPSVPKRGKPNRARQDPWKVLAQMVQGTSEPIFRE